MRRILLLLALGTACQGTQPDQTAVLDGNILGEVVRATLLAATVATEVVHSLADPPSGFGTCTLVMHQGHTWGLHYGTGCTPTQGTTSESLAGDALLVAPAGTLLFEGDLMALGPSGAAVTGTLVGEAALGGDIFSMDTTVSGWVWGEQSARTLDGLLEIDRDSTDWSLQMDGATLGLGRLTGFEVDADAVVLPAAALGPCSVPASGSMRVHLGEEWATLTLTEGAISAQVPGGEPFDVALCP